jgi:ribonuclease Y
MSQQEILILVVTFLISTAIMIPIGFILRKKIAESKIESAENEAKRLLENANIEAENKKKEEIFKAKEEIHKARNELDQEIKERRGEIGLQEKRMIQKEETLEKRSEFFERKEKDLDRKYQEADEQKRNLEEVFKRQMSELQRISGLSKEEATRKLLEDLDKQITTEKATLLREHNAKLKEDSMKSAKEIVGYAIKKCAADHTSETTVSVV